jgi:hypothetical protein
MPVQAQAAQAQAVQAQAVQAQAAQAHADAGRSRRRVGWRKGSEVDEELWPTESFGGVSDEQFWDDLASDKPLATTARTVGPPASGARRRLPDVVPGRDGDNRGRADGNRLGPQPIQSGPQPIQGGPQPIQGGPQPIQGGPQPTPVAGRSYQPGTHPQSYQPAAQSYPPAAQSYPPATQPSYQPATQPAPIVGQGGRGGLPADPRGRGRMANGTDAVAAEDPLTSAAYSLRPPGAVDGRSQPPRRSRDQYEATLAQETQSFSLADTQAATGGYPGGVPPFRQYEAPAGSGNGNGRGQSDGARYDGLRSDPLRTDPLRTDPLRTDPLRTDPLRTDPLRTDPLRTDPVRSDSPRSDAYWSGGRADPPRTPAGTDLYGSSTAAHPYPERPYSDPARSAATPPTPSYGETYGYGYPVNPADDPRQPNGTWGQGRSAGNGNWGARQPSYPTGNGYRGPYDPRANGHG